MSLLSSAACGGIGKDVSLRTLENGFLLSQEKGFKSNARIAQIFQAYNLCKFYGQIFVIEGFFDFLNDDRIKRSFSELSKGINLRKFTHCYFPTEN